MAARASREQVRDKGEAPGELLYRAEGSLLVRRARREPLHKLSDIPTLQLTTSREHLVAIDRSRNRADGRSWERHSAR
jgi:hypothetical protein